MEVYKIAHDTEAYKFFVFEDDGKSSLKAMEFKGNSLRSSWEPINFEIFTDKKKKVDSRKVDFDASCYNSGILIIKEFFKNVFEKKFGNQIELLPVKTKGVDGDFLYLNVLTIIDCINKDEKDFSEIMQMIKDNKIIFKKVSISNFFVFRDNKLTTQYFCTNPFIEFVESLNIKGLRFEKVGIAE